MTLPKDAAKVGYMCATTFMHHVGKGNDPEPQQIYPTIKRLKADYECVRSGECAVYEVEIKVKRIAKKGMY